MKYTYLTDIERNLLSSEWKKIIMRHDYMISSYTAAGVGVYICLHTCLEDL